MVDNIEKMTKFYTDWQEVVAVMFGMILQFSLGDKRGMRVALTIGVSSIFVALYIVPVIIEVAKLNPTGKVAIAIYALSAIVSVEIIAVLIKILPEAMQVRTKRFLGVENDLS